MQAHFVALLHTLLTLLLARLEQTGIGETKVTKPPQQRREKIPSDHHLPAQYNGRHAFTLTCYPHRAPRHPR